MSVARSVLPLVLLALLPAGAAAAWPHNPSDNLPVSTAANGQTAPQVVLDGTGGAIVVWLDGRSGVETKVYARRVLASGVNDPAWPAGGSGRLLRARTTPGRTARDGMAATTMAARWLPACTSSGSPPPT
jgi:hypothetical protein